ncbi:hypothetical protein [Hymenobacter koreensis]|uniref:Uncharacterized protein n=1 Tax=Hymenobacter koreensis TaxID=1084523 RepID=A0ABP8JK31_9BACT
MSATENFQQELHHALQPLLERAKRRLARIRHLQAEPATEETAKAIAREAEEIQLIRDATQQIGTLFGQLSEFIDIRQAPTRALLQAQSEAHRNLNAFTPLIQVLDFEQPLPAAVARRLNRLAPILARYPNGCQTPPPGWDNTLLARHARTLA